MKQAFILVLALLVTITTKAQQPKAFEVKVTGKGQPIIFIPGATCGGDEWDETVAHLGGKYQCHVLTMAGYAGARPLENGPYLETYKKQIEQYISDNKLQHVIIVGHSIGGFLAIWMASEMKDRLEKVVVVDAMPFYALVMNPNAKAGYDEAKAQAAYERYGKMDSAAFKVNQSFMARFMCLDSTRWDKIVAWGMHSDRRTMAYTMTEMMSNDLRETVANIKVPVLVMDAWAPNPQYPAFTQEHALKAYQDQYKACKTCTVHITDYSKHFIMYDEPQWFYKELDTFIGAK